MKRPIFPRALAITIIAAGPTAAGAEAADNAPLPEADRPTIGYSSVAAAAEGLHAKRGVTFEQQGDGWIVAVDRADQAIWSFSPPDYPAYPAVVKRRAVSVKGGSKIEMTVQCEAEKQACDDLVRTFDEMNQQAVVAASRN